MSTQPPTCSESTLVGELAPQHSAESSSSAVSFLETSPTHASCVNTQDPVPTRPPARRLPIRDRFQPRMAMVYYSSLPAVSK